MEPAKLADEIDELSRSGPPHGMELETVAIPVPLLDGVAAPVRTAGTLPARERSRSPWRPCGEVPFGLGSVDLSHQYGYRDGTLWCWRCGSWSTCSRRRSRLKDPRGIPTTTAWCTGCLEASRREHWYATLMADPWHPSAFRLSRTRTSADTGHKFPSKKTARYNSGPTPPHDQGWCGTAP